MMDESDQQSAQDAADALSLERLEDLALKLMKDDTFVIRHRGQVEVAREMRALATSNIADILYEDDEGVVRMRPLNELPREVTASIKKIKISRDRVRNDKRVFDEEGNLSPSHVDMTGEVVEIELWDKTGPLDKLMRHYGGYAEDNKQLAGARADNASANLDLLLGAIGSQPMQPTQLVHSPENDSFTPDWTEEEDEI